MAKIAICRSNLELPTGAVLDAARDFLFRVLVGIDRENDKAWKKFWKRIIGAEPGELLFLELVFPRNAKFHRKFFALLNLGFDAWEPDRKHKTYKGRVITKNFDRFREDITILAGFYEQTFNLKGRMKLTAQSISFANMDDVEFERLYSAVVDVLLREVCKNYKNRDEIDRVVQGLIGFF
jgi:hypothetical protein